MKLSIKDFFSKCDQIRSFLTSTDVPNIKFLAWFKRVLDTGSFILHLKTNY